MKDKTNRKAAEGFGLSEDKGRAGRSSLARDCSTACRASWGTGWALWSGLSCSFALTHVLNIVELAVADGLFGLYGSERANELFMSSPIPPSLLNLMVSVDVMHHVYLMHVCRCVAEVIIIQTVAAQPFPWPCVSSLVPTARVHSDASKHRDILALLPIPPLPSPPPPTPPPPPPPPHQPQASH